MTNTTTTCNVSDDNCQGAASTYARSGTTTTLCSAHGQHLLPYGWIMVPMDDEVDPIVYVTDEDLPWLPREACQGCGTVDAATDHDDDEGRAPLCSDCERDRAMLAGEQ